MTVRAIFGGEAIDATPDQFTFTDTAGVNPNTVTTSGTVTVTGLSPNIPISVTASGGTVDAGTSSLSGTFASSKSITTSATGTFVMAARATSSASFSTAVNVVVTVSGVSDTFTVTTRAADTTPNAFTFTDQTGAELNTVYSTMVYPDNYDYASWSVTGGQGSIDGTTWSTSGTITKGTYFRVRGTSSSSYSTAVNVVGTIGGVSDVFTITTRAADTTPNGFSFTDVTNASLGTQYTSNTLTITGMDPSQSVTVTASGGTVDAGTTSLSGTFASSKTVTTSGSGTIVVAARVTSSSSYSTAVNCTVTINGVSDTYSVTTLAADTTPNAFGFTDVTNAALSTVYTSNTVYVSGMSPNYSSITVSASGGTVDAGTSGLSGTFSSSKSVTTDGSGGFYVAARVTSSASYTTAVNCTVNISGITDTYTVTTQGVPTGEAVLTTDGSTWTVPAGVTSVCLVAVAPGVLSTKYQGPGGPGGGLMYANNVSVIPGDVFTLVTGVSVGSGSFGRPESYTEIRKNGTQVLYNYVKTPNAGGAPQYTQTSSFTTTNFQGGAGGGIGTSGTTPNAGGGGAAGYSGNGGNGGNSGANGSSGSGGGGGGGAGDYLSGGSSVYRGGAGGGVGLYGAGSNGAGGASPTASGGGGSGGSAGQTPPGTVYNGIVANIGGSYGGGAGGALTDRWASAQVGSGAVRFMWGPGRSFPNNAT